jgi:catechol 2,3-dioxygenase-like lactoylglutathione lyase family enzyme
MNELALITLVVPDYDEAIAFFTDALDFELRDDRLMGDKRWVVVGPRGGRGAGLVLGRAANDAQRAAIGNQTGGRVFLFLHTDNFDTSYARLASHGVRFTETPRHEAYGKVVVFLDPYGNKWDLIEPVRT